MYTIEQKLASKNGYFTPAEARNYYGRYDRSGFTVHWWNTREATPKGSHDNIVNYILGKASAGSGSVNYVVSDAKITLLVGPDNVAWASQGGNPTTISCEFDPWLSDEGYKKGGWLISQLEERYNRTLQLFPHNHWFSTQCPGSISLDRLRQEANKWKTGGYNPAPPTNPTPVPVISFAATTPQRFKMNKEIVNLYNVNKNSWSEIANSVIGTFKKGELIDIHGVVRNANVNGEWYVTKYSLDNKTPNGFSKADLDVYIEPTPEPPKPIEPVIETIAPVTMYTLDKAKLVNIKDLSVVNTYALDTPMEIMGKSTFNGKDFFLTRYAVEKGTKQGFLAGDLKPGKEQPNPEPTPDPQPPVPSPELPEWERNLRDIDDTTYWFTKQQDLIDIITGKPTGTKTFVKDEEYVGSALTIANGVEYRITEYSFSKGIFNGVPTNSLTLTKPGEPNIPPVTEDPNKVDKNVVIAFLQTIITLITNFINGLKK